MAAPRLFLLTLTSLLGATALAATGRFKHRVSSDPADHEFFTYMLRALYHGADHAEAMQTFFEVQQQRCEVPGASSFGFSLLDHGRSSNGCAQCHYLLAMMVEGGAAVAKDPHLPLVAAHCRKLVEFPCCEGHKPAPLTMVEANAAAFLEVDSHTRRIRSRTRSSRWNPWGAIKAAGNAVVAAGKFMGDKIRGGAEALADKAGGVMDDLGKKAQEMKDGLVNLAGQAADKVKKFYDEHLASIFEGIKADQADQSFKDAVEKSAAAWKKHRDSKRSKYEPSDKGPFFGHARCDPGGGQGSPPPIEGYALLHEHMFSWLGWGGVYIFGRSNGTLEEGVPSCSGGTDHGIIDLELMGHSWRTHGYDADVQKAFVGWPRWDTNGHIMAHEEWLKAAFQRKDKYKLSVFTVTAGHHEQLCTLASLLNMIPEKFRTEWKESGYDENQICATVPNVERQIRAANEMAERNKDWMGIATTGKECRELAAQKKLCILLSIEVGEMCRHENLHDPKNRWKDKQETPAECIERWHKMGVRSSFITHSKENRYGTPARTSEVDGVLTNFLERLTRFRKEWAQLGSSHSIFSLFRGTPDELAKNVAVSAMEDAKGYTSSELAQKYPAASHIKYKGDNDGGLTAEGKQLAEEMFKHGWIVELSHLSRGSQRDLYVISSKKFNFSPLIFSHSLMVEGWEAALGKDMQKMNYYADFEMLQMLLETGGILGSRTDKSGAPTYRKSRTPWATPKLRWKDSNPLASPQALLGRFFDFMAREVGLPMAIATDLNGGGDQMANRFYDPKRDPHGLFKFDASMHTDCHRAMKLYGFLGNTVGGLSGFPSVDQLASLGQKIHTTFSPECRQNLARTLYMQEYLEKNPKLAPRTWDAWTKDASIPDWRKDPEGWTDHMFDTQGIGTVSSVGSLIKDMDQYGANVDCPICVLRSGEHLIRTWERASMDPQDRPVIRPSFRPFARLPLQCEKTDEDDDGANIVKCDQHTDIGRLVLQTLGIQLDENRGEAEKRSWDKMGDDGSEKQWDGVSSTHDTDEYHKIHGDELPCKGPWSDLPQADKQRISKSRYDGTTPPEVHAGGKAKAGTTPADDSQCQNSEFGCCPDGEEKATGVCGKGCAADPSHGFDTINPSSEFCGDSLFGCCPDGATSKINNKDCTGCPGYASVATARVCSVFAGVYKVPPLPPASEKSQRFTASFVKAEESEAATAFLDLLDSRRQENKNTWGIRLPRIRLPRIPIPRIRIPRVPPRTTTTTTPTPASAGRQQWGELPAKLHDYWKEWNCDKYQYDDTEDNPNVPDNVCDLVPELATFLDCLPSDTVSGGEAKKSSSLMFKSSRSFAQDGPGFSDKGEDGGDYSEARRTLRGIDHLLEQELQLLQGGSERH